MALTARQKGLLRSAFQSDLPEATQSDPEQLVKKVFDFSNLLGTEQVAERRRIITAFRQRIANERAQIDQLVIEQKANLDAMIVELDNLLLSVEQ